ncbi:MAG: nicotinate (nicotinamide) nucleotide adenylyltransferase [Chlorobium sp.]
MHIAVFGGSFDPPHNGHLALCLFARELLEIDWIIISVSNNPLKLGPKVEDYHRKRMAELLSSELNETGFCSEVSSWELEKKKPSYTVDLMRHIHDRYPSDKVTLLVGEDSFTKFPLWKEHERLSELCDVVVFKRDSGLPQRGQSVFRVIDFTCPVSSTEVRRRVKAGESFSRVLPSSLFRYITTQKLYR